jgi:hypothetical protein
VITADGATVAVGTAVLAAVGDVSGAVVAAPGGGADVVGVALLLSSLLQATETARSAERQRAGRMKRGIEKAYARTPLDL